MGDIHYLVDKLNGPPFNLDVTLLSFSAKTPQELLQLLSDVFAAISPKHQKTNIAKESIDDTVDRLVTFLKIVKYKPRADPITFRQLLASGDRDLTYIILRWVLPQAQQLEKRAFVGYFLSFPDMPEEMFYDSDILDLRESIKQLHQDFIQTHKEHDAAENAIKDLPAMKQRLKRLEEERERLGDKVRRAKEVAAGMPEAKDYTELCAALRRERDEEVAISQQLQVQRQQLERSEVVYQRSAGRLREMQANTRGNMSGERLLEALEQDVIRLRMQVSEKYPKELETKQRRLQALQEALNNGVNTEVDLQRFMNQAATLQSQIQSIQDRMAAAEKARQGDRAYLQVRQAQQMLTLVSRKKSELQAKTDRLEEQKEALVVQLDRHGGAGDDGSGVSDEEWRAKYEAIKGQLPTYKNMKKDLGELEGEAYVLARTVEVLKQQEAAAAAAVERLEDKKGIQGYADVAAGLEAVSEAKGALDEAKGAVLSEVSSTVEAITAALRQKKAQLAPKVAELRSARAACTELETQHAAAKAAYDASVGALEAQVAGLKAEVERIQEEAAAAERSAYLADCQITVLDGHLKRLLGAPGEEVLKQRYQQQILEAEAQLRQLREQQRAIKGSHSSGLEQLGMLGDLVQLLQIKLQLTQRGGGLLEGELGGGQQGPFGTAAASKSFHTATASVMVL